MIVNGKNISAHVKEVLKNKRETRDMRLDIVYVGQHKAIEQYVRAKKKFGEEIGVTVVVNQFATQTTEGLIDCIQNISKTSDGIIIQLPLPDSIDKENVLNSVPEYLDIDLLSLKAQQSFLSGETKRLPPVVGACAEIISYHNIDLHNKKIVILGKGMLVGIPISIWLTHLGFSFVHMSRESFDRDILKEADVIFSGIGVPHFVKKDMLKQHVIIFDAGTSEDKETVQGDIDPEVSTITDLFTPVPGGIGPLTVSSLFKNMFQ